jgi:hypothetical protein
MDSITFKLHAVEEQKKDDSGGDPPLITGTYSLPVSPGPFFSSFYTALALG